MIISEAVMEEEYAKEEKTISLGKANLIAVVVMVPVGMVLLVFYYLLYALPDLQKIGVNDYFSSLLMILVGFLFLTVVHEFIHGFVWHFYCKNRWKSIKFGIAVKLLTPYCHCRELLFVWQYRLGTAAPLLLTGILPYLISLICGNFVLMAVSLLMIIGAGGDTAILLLLKNAKPYELISDHPSLCGCIVYHEKEFFTD